MSKLDSSDLVDIFKEEVTKKAKKDIRAQKKKEKKLEKKENAAFQKMQKAEAKEEKIKEKEKTQEIYLTEEKEEVQKEVVKEKDKRNESLLYFLYDVLFGFFMILLLFATFGFIFFECKDGVENKEIIKLVCLGFFSVCYVLSMLMKKHTIQKLASILAVSAICLWMVLTLYYT